MNCKKRVFICFNDIFPFGNANSNYVRNLALTLEEANFEVIVIGVDERANSNFNIEDELKYNNIKYRNILKTKSRLPFRISNHLKLGKMMCKILDSYNITQEDYIIVYSDFISVSREILKKYKNLNNGHIIYCIVEWFQAYQYSLSFMNLDYIMWRIHFDLLMPKYKRVITISENLKKHFEQKGCNTFILPCLVDVDQSKLNSSLDIIKNKEYYNFIYSGAATNKDSIDGMIKGLFLLDNNEKKRVKLHFTTMTLDKLIKATTCSIKDLDKIKNCLEFHGWLEYEELLDLYKEMDFLLLAREKNIITISNFPSKVPELLCYGVIPVCSDVGDYTKKYLKDGIDSIVFKGDSAECCAKAIRRAMSIDNNKLLNMRYNARKCAEDKFDYRNWSCSIKSFLE